MMHSRKVGVSILVREKGYWSSVLPPDEAALVGEHLRQHHVDLHLNTQLKQILKDEKGRVRGVLTSEGKEIPCQFLGITIGVAPAIAFLYGSGVETDRGVLVDEFFRTSVDDVYAIGDCAQYRQPPPGRKAIEQVWYTGRAHGLLLAATICGQPSPYRPGPWYNSAKFFDVEYQVYGDVPNQLPDDFDWLYWQHPEKPLALRLVWEKSSGIFRGVNLLGIRYRQEVCEQWIVDKVKIDQVMAALHQANFDPEFHNKYEDEIRKAFTEKTGKEVPLRKRKKWLFF